MCKGNVNQHKHVIGTETFSLINFNKSENLEGKALHLDQQLSYQKLFQG